jgi:hypothetical protein
MPIKLYEITNQKCRGFFTAFVSASSQLKINNDETRIG